MAAREAVDDVGEPALRVEAVQARGFERGVDDGGALAARVRAEEEEILARDGDASQRSLGRVIIDAEASVGGEARERVPASERVLQRLGERGLARQAAALGVHPVAQID